MQVSMSGRLSIITVRSVWFMGAGEVVFSSALSLLLVLSVSHYCGLYVYVVVHCIYFSW